MWTLALFNKHQSHYGWCNLQQKMPPTNPDVWSQSMSSSIKKCNDNMRRRFNDDQIKSLEDMFETESRPELRTKQQLAKRLGLQPRQVAIWFQNKRARSKSKQLELEYRMLQMSYDNLGSKYELLKKEHASLLIQVVFYSISKNYAHPGN